MSEAENRLRILSIEVNDLLSRCIHVHDDLLKFSWRRVIPLPRLFVAIDFRRLHTEARQIRIELETCCQRTNVLKDTAENEWSQLAQCLSDYEDKLKRAVLLLEDILERHLLKSQGIKKYSWRENRRQWKLCDKAVRDYVTIGDQLNRLFGTLGPCSRS